MNIHFLGQAALQAAGLIYGAIKYRNKNIDHIDRYVPKNQYALPFDGEWYTANGGVTPNTSHSWEILPQRFAYDFIIINEEGESFCGDKKDLNSYYCYGKDVHAPADGIIVSTKNRFPDCRIMDNGQTDPDTPDIGGNRIIIKHSPNEYSAICHLMPGSIKVQKGQAVKRGDVIGKCGNSGNTTEPHVHFQLQNTARFYSCIGLPILFSDIKTRRYENYCIADARPLPGEKDSKDGYIHRGLFVSNFKIK
ncbi:M23 family metallopeptidase [Anaerostipes sp.]|uniref:M23 family metallopeptidase n=1 Tax=Anaerostipes sp. TaxID=1872530 RepID=UPI0025C3977C|nr:M23 family metallopeptidase [Anaerostipes sp.]MBS7007521.1 M23 family metallopeptidase [Anaerostipes sp.]